MRASYQTTARRYLEEFFRKHPDEHFTTQQICRAIAADAHTEDIGKSTIYRQLAQLCRENKIRRFEEKDPQSGAVTHLYQSAADGECLRHFHLKCTVCGQVRHLDCDRSDQLVQHLLAAHGFSVDCGRSILYGICRECGPRRLPFAEEAETAVPPPSHKTTSVESGGAAEAESGTDIPPADSSALISVAPASPHAEGTAAGTTQSQDLPDTTIPDATGKESSSYVH